MRITDNPKFKIALSLLFFAILTLNLTMCKEPMQQQEREQKQLIYNEKR